MSSDAFGSLQRRALKVPALVVLILSLALTAVATYFAYNYKQVEFDRQVGEFSIRLSAAIDDRLASYGNLLQDLRSFILTSAPTRNGFEHFIQGLELSSRYPGILGIGYATVVPSDGLKAYEDGIRAQGLKGYQVWPKGPRPLYVPLQFFEPALGDWRETLGFDLAADSDRRAAIEMARDTGQPSLSRHLNYLAEDARSRLPGFLMVVPVYAPGLPLATVEERRAAVRAYVYAPFRGRDLLEQIAQEQTENLPDVSFEVYDGGGENPDRLLFASKTESSKKRNGDFRRSLKKIVDNHEWTVVVDANPAAFDRARGFRLHLWVLLLGTLASLIIYLFARAATEYSRSLEKSESLLSLVTNAMPGLVGYVNRDGRFLYNNLAYQTWWGKSPAELRDQPVAFGLGPSYEVFYKPLLARALNGEHVTFESSEDAPSAPSGRRYVRGEYIPDVGPDGEVQGVVVLVNDQTEEKQVQDRLRDERRITELINEVGMSLQAELDVERLAQKITDVATELTGAEAGAFIYHLKPDKSDGASAVSGPLKDDVSLPPSSPRLTTSSFQDEHILRLDDIVGIRDFDRCCPCFTRPPGKSPLRSYLAAPVVSRSGQILGGLVFAHTRAGVFTERAEKLVAGIAAQAAVALDNAKLYSEAQAINRVKDEFLATLSHELRTPMNVILGYSELLMDENFPDSVKAYVDAIYRNAKTQNQLIADLLDISAIITGKLSFQPVRMNTAEVVRSAVENIRFAAESKGVALRESLPMDFCPIIGDPTRLQQIVWNLLSNAVKFTPSGGQVTVQVRGEGGRCLIEVADTGIGIDREFLPYVFERFSQEDSSRSRRFGGLGLGLSIVRQLVELHGGQIRVDSQGKNKGAVFVVSLPMAPTPVPVIDKS